MVKLHYSKFVCIRIYLYLQNVSIDLNDLRKLSFALIGNPCIGRKHNLSYELRLHKEFLLAAAMKFSEIFALPLRAKNFHV